MLPPMKHVVVGSMALGLAFVAACGAKVVVDTPGEGTGGAGGTGTIDQASSVGPQNSSVGPGPVVVSVGPGPGPVGPGPGPVGPGPGPSVVSSVSTGPQSCDGQGDCGVCIDCAINDSCSGLWSKCLAFEPCEGLLNCLPGCMDQTCYDKCLAVYADGIDLYNETAICLVCSSCYGDCDGQGQGCP